MQRKRAKFSGVNVIDVYKWGHPPLQLLSNICSFSRCLAAEWTKCYGNLSVGWREVLPVWIMVGASEAWPSHVDTPLSCQAQDHVGISQCFLSTLNTTKVCVARDWVTVAEEQESKVSIRC